MNWGDRHNAEGWIQPAVNDLVGDTSFTSYALKFTRCCATPGTLRGLRPSPGPATSSLKLAGSPSYVPGSGITRAWRDSSRCRVLLARWRQHVVDLNGGWPSRQREGRPGMPDQ